MSAHATYAFAPSKIAPTDGIRSAEPISVTNFAKCEMNINVGVFFDGTGNNRDADRATYKHSNIVRLWAAYLDAKPQGYFPIYIPGVGTKFADLREFGESMLGGGVGLGCEARVLYGLLMLLNAIHGTACNGEPLISKTQLTALCCNSDGSAGAADNDDIRKLRISGGLLSSGDSAVAARDKKIIDLASAVQWRLNQGKVKIKECFVDVFGFSRGAAQARVFCSWLDRLLKGGKLAGVVVHIRFLGIMDTVASAGFWAKAVGTGHGGWADPAYLRVPESVVNCVHMVAMHELRNNFPLDSVTRNGRMPPNCREFAYPGAHSDVGGGYLPSALGISVGKDAIESDALKLAQIPLNHMFDCAVKAGVPLSRDRARGKGTHYDPFAIAPALQSAFEHFLDTAALKARPMHEWLQPYLTWRWNRRLVYESLEHVRKASTADRALLIKYNNYLLDDIALLDRAAKRTKGGVVSNILSLAGTPIREANTDLVRMTSMDVDAREILRLARNSPHEECMRFHDLFDGFVHDSLAGFDLHSVELSGHWRYRKGFLGSEQTIVADLGASESVSSTA